MLEFEDGPARDLLLDVALVTFLQHFAVNDSQVVGLYWFRIAKALSRNALEEASKLRRCLQSRLEISTYYM